MIDGRFRAFGADDVEKLPASVQKTTITDDR
jgi:hypothetical protein